MGTRRTSPRRTRPGSTSGPSSCRPTWAGRRVVLHVGAAESVLIVRLNDRDVGDQQGLAPGRRVRPDRPRPTRIEHAQPAGREVVRRDVRRGPGPVVARRDHPVRVPLRDRAGLPRRHPGDPGPRRRPHDRDARPQRRSSASRATTSSRAGSSRRAWRAWPSRSGRTPGASIGARSWAGPSTTSACCTAAPPACRCPRPTRPRWSAMYGRMAPPLDGSVGWRIEVPGVDRWSAEEPRLYALTVTLRAPNGTVAEEVELRVGFRRVEIVGLDLLINGERVLHPRRQPPRLRPAHRPDDQPRRVARRPRA